MTTSRQRRRPGSESPFQLKPTVEAIVPGAASPPVGQPPAVEQAKTEEVSNAPATGTATRQPSKSAKKLVLRTDREPSSDPKLARTFQLRESLLGSAQTAVLRTAEYEGGYLSLNALVEGAVRRELERLAEEFNAGEPFPPHAGKFRAGRPIGT